MKGVVFALFMSASLFLYDAQMVSAQSATDTAKAWQEWEARFDVKSICRSGKMITDMSAGVLRIPEGCAGMDIDVAKTPPVVDFGIIQNYEPWYLPVLYHDDYRRGGIWEGYGDVTRDARGRYYFSIGDHRSYNGNAYIVRYDPAQKKHDIIVDLKKITGWTSGDYADSKIHGDLDVSPNGDIWFLTYFGPFPTEEEWATVYRGSLLMTHNVNTGVTKNLGIPLEGSTWPYYNCDFDRSTFFGVAEEDGVIIVFDTKEQKMLYGGAPKHGISWHRRCTMLDHGTGFFYSTDTITYKDGERYRGDQHFVSYQRRNNVFTRMSAKVPVNPATGKTSPIRAHTSEKDSDGAFWCFSDNGVMFRFYPSEDRTEYIGLNWGAEGAYVTNMSFSPKKRYIYYIVREPSTAIVQYDTTTDRKKVIAFLSDFYTDTYGYRPTMSYGLELDEKGESIFCYCSGGFTEKGTAPKYSRPSMFHIHIPASERVE